MRHTEKKVFKFNHAPTGAEVAGLVADNNLQDWKMDIKREETSFELYFYYYVIFEREVSG